MAMTVPTLTTNTFTDSCSFTLTVIDPCGDEDLNSLVLPGNLTYTYAINSGKYTGIVYPPVGIESYLPYCGYGTAVLYGYDTLAVSLDGTDLVIETTDETYIGTTMEITFMSTLVDYPDFEGPL